MTDPVFGLDFEPMIFGGTPEAQEAQSRVIDGPPANVKHHAPAMPSRPQVVRALVAMTGAQLKAQLRARLAVVKREIKLRQKLEAERDELLRLLAAAENKTHKTSPRADVRPIRHVAG